MNSVLPPQQPIFSVPLIGTYQDKEESRYQYWYSMNSYTCTNTDTGMNFYCSAWPRLKLNTKIGVHTTTHHHHTNSLAAISQLLLTQFWSNFKHRALGTSTTDSNCHCDICPGNICPGDICPYQHISAVTASIWTKL